MAFLSRSRYFLCSLLLGPIALPQALRAQEIPLEHCDALPVITVKIGDRPSLFLVDTAATSMLNLASFAEGSAKDIRVTSWTGTLATSAKEVAIEELAVGRTTLLKLKLPAIDLSAIGKACGKKIDGILGVDLLGKLGASINLKQQTLHLATTDEKRAEELVTAMQIEMHRCVEAFNSSDERAFGDCLDPKIVLFSGEAELYGREKVTGYFREKYFHQKPAAKLDIRENSFHSIGEAIWYEYEFTIDSSRGRLRGRGMAMCKKSEGRWRMASMHHSILEWQSAEAASENSQ
ncbi:MAG: nuclear transport factor 2 family protein [Candidatus Acidiferrum sp.]|jgi:ketosteroid isomerase-like protein/predicted aspartyl protease